MPAIEINGLDGSATLSGVTPGAERGGENDQPGQEMCCSRENEPHIALLIFCPWCTTINYDGCLQTSCLITWLVTLIPAIGWIFSIVYAVAMWEPNVRKNNSEAVIGAPMVAGIGLPAVSVEVTQTAPQPAGEAQV